MKHANDVADLAVSPNGRLLASAAGRFALLWPADARGEIKDPVRAFQFGGRATSVAFSSDSRRLAAGSADGSYRVWNLDSSAYTVGAPIDHDRLLRSLCLTSPLPRLTEDQWSKLFPREKYRSVCD
jgi:WD40 repeat protein